MPITLVICPTLKIQDGFLTVLNLGLSVERRGRDRKGRGEKKGGEGKVKDGGVSAWGFQRGC
jgi:hypothetical protein